MFVIGWGSKRFPYFNWRAWYFEYLGLSMLFLLIQIYNVAFNPRNLFTQFFVKSRFRMVQLLMHFVWKQVLLSGSNIITKDCHGNKSLSKAMVNSEMFLHFKLQPKIQCTFQLKSIYIYLLLIYFILLLKKKVYLFIKV